MPGDVGATTAELRALGARLSGDVVVPSDDGWDEARQAWNLGRRTASGCRRLPGLGGRRRGDRRVRR